MVRESIEVSPRELARREGMAPSTLSVARHALAETDTPSGRSRKRR